MHCSVHVIIMHLLCCETSVPCHCLQEKIVRVVHLWQKNNVFPPETLQSLLQQDGSSDTSSAQAGAVDVAAAVAAAQQDNTEAAYVISLPGSATVILHFSVHLTLVRSICPSVCQTCGL